MAEAPTNLAYMRGNAAGRPLRRLHFVRTRSEGG